MNLKLGDFVRFVDERIEGYVTRIFDDNMIGVTGEDDFEIPVPVNKVTLVHGQRSPETEEQPVKELAIPPGEFNHRGVNLVVAPDLRKGSVVYLNLLNQTSFKLLATLTTETTDRFKGEFFGIINPGEVAKIYSANLNDLNSWPKLNIQVLYYTNQDIPLKQPLQFSEKFKAKDFAGAKKYVTLLKQEAWVIPLEEEELKIDAEKLKESFFKPSEEKKEIGSPQREVDLHIEKLREDHQFLSNTEILNAQLEVFKKALDAAIVHKQNSIIFIHGVGNGRLKNEIHKRLSKHQQVKTFLDARKEKFGYGATEVILK